MTLQITATDIVRVRQWWDIARNRGTGLSSDPRDRPRALLAAMTNQGHLYGAAEFVVRQMARLLRPCDADDESRTLAAGYDCLILFVPASSDVVSALDALARRHYFGVPYEQAARLAATLRAQAEGRRMDAIRHLAADIDTETASALLYAACSRVAHDLRGGWYGVAACRAVLAAMRSRWGEYDAADAAFRSLMADAPAMAE